MEVVADLHAQDLDRVVLEGRVGLRMTNGRLQRVRIIQACSKRRKKCSGHPRACNVRLANGNRWRCKWAAHSKSEKVTILVPRTMCSQRALPSRRAQDVLVPCYVRRRRVTVAVPLCRLQEAQFACAQVNALCVDYRRIHQT